MTSRTRRPPCTSPLPPSKSPRLNAATTALTTSTFEGGIGSKYRALEQGNRPRPPVRRGRPARRRAGRACARGAAGAPARAGSTGRPVRGDEARDRGGPPRVPAARPRAVGRAEYTAREVAEQVGAAARVPARRARGGRPRAPGPGREGLQRRGPEGREDHRGAAIVRDPGRGAARDHAGPGPQPRAGRRGDPLRGGGRVSRERHHRVRARAAQRRGSQQVPAPAWRRCSRTSCGCTCATWSATRRSARRSSPRARRATPATCTWRSPTSSASPGSASGSSSASWARSGARLTELALQHTKPPTRLVKTIGDAVMFVVARRGAAARHHARAGRSGSGERRTKLPAAARRRRRGPGGQPGGRLVRAAREPRQPGDRRRAARAACWPRRRSATRPVTATPGRRPARGS